MEGTVSICTCGQYIVCTCVPVHLHIPLQTYACFCIPHIHACSLHTRVYIHECGPMCSLYPSICGYAYLTMYTSVLITQVFACSCVHIQACIHVHTMISMLTCAPLVGLQLASAGTEAPRSHHGRLVLLVTGKAAYKPSVCIKGHFYLVPLGNGFISHIVTDPDPLDCPNPRTAEPEAGTVALISHL